MRKIYFQLLTLLLSASLLYSFSPACSQVHARDLKASMNSLLVPFKAIQPFIASEDQFLDPKQSDSVYGIIQDLRKNFHTLEALPTKYHSLPGFDENIRSVADLLDDTSRRFAEGKTTYAWWRLRKLPTDCFTCHATYKVSNHYSNEAVIDQSLDVLSRARFLLATRQFAAARQAFLSVLSEPRYQLYYNEALRSLVLITTRIDQNPAEGARILRSVTSSASLYGDDSREALRWATELDSWSKEKPARDANPVRTAEQLIARGSRDSLDSPQNDVALLRGTAILHQQLEDGKISKELRPRAIYLLGFAYTKLPLFFSESWAEMYLERCIAEFPGTDMAQKAYRVYREQIIDDYTGTAGTDIPAEIKLHLEQLHQKAYGVGTFSPIVRRLTSKGKTSTKL